MIGLFALCHCTVAALLQSIPQPTYNYFAFGSNLDPATMRSLRNLNPIGASAAVLLDYALRFDVPGNPLLEPSAASVQPCPGAVVHGVVYQLTDADFARVGSSEGVPFAYRWKSCRVVTYVGDGECAGAAALRATGTNYLDAYTLCKHTNANVQTKQQQFIPPSASYLKIIRDGARYWKLDRSYQDELSQAVVAQNLLVKDGLSGTLLAFAKLLNPKP
jgi:hypothetical protein